MKSRICIKKIANLAFERCLLSGSLEVQIMCGFLFKMMFLLLCGCILGVLFKWINICIMKSSNF